LHHTAAAAAAGNEKSKKKTAPKIGLWVTTPIKVLERFEGLAFCCLVPEMYGEL
jgi:hypothetical protein